MPIFSEPHKIFEHEAWFRRQVQAGLDSANTDDVISAVQVEAEATAWRAELRQLITTKDTKCLKDHLKLSV